MRLCLVLAASLISTAVWADVADSRDLEVLPRFPGSQIVTYKQLSDQERVYPQGAIRRISGKLRFEREVMAQGSFTAVTYELPRTHSASEAFNSAREALHEQNAELLYWCVGRECGSSNLWANSVFNNATLYGSDAQQSYALLRLAEPRQDSLLALYSITRGNGRAYLQVEQLDAASTLPQILPTPATLQRALKTSGELRLPKLSEPTDEWVALLARSLNLDSTLRVALSGEAAAAWRDALIGQQVRAARLELDTQAVTGLQVNVLR
ncbi:DUF4892 domain-containing protein [Pseudomonas sp. TTU2014-080ASC]|uniref:DUF4892 domain-containing protein n=1 Tax=Pseudomonas sp. TTU2014-080ASC TaxID=1729724 RepID=UPI000A3DCAA4|nr:DUF4892 domain-containing protein [Pseudomonas sp. TTU2014-080ASC]